ncbi:MAG: ABC transporter permease [Eubacteriales bacterium]
MNYYLFGQMIKRDFRQRYKGSILGILWSVIIPIVMLAIYTFVFGEIFQAKWSQDSDNKFEYAFIIFCGLCVVNMVTEVMNRSTMAILGNVNYVKKVVFPLEILPVSMTITAVANASISFTILIIGSSIFLNQFYIVSLEVFLLLIPLVVMNMGVAFFLSAITVYYRDMLNLVGIMSTIILYISPVFYSVEGVPAMFKNFIYINPLTLIIENARNVCLEGTHINALEFGIMMVMSSLILFLGYWIFNRLKKGFADVM